jgi:hypothetical protein
LALNVNVGNPARLLKWYDHFKSRVEDHFPCAEELQLRNSNVARLPIQFLMMSAALDWPLLAFAI